MSQSRGAGLRVLRSDLAQAIGMLAAGAEVEPDAADATLADLLRLSRLLRQAKLEARILEIVRIVPGLSSNGVVRTLGAERPKALKALRRLEAAGRLRGDVATVGKRWTGTDANDQFASSVPVPLHRRLRRETARTNAPVKGEGVRDGCEEGG